MPLSGTQSHPGRWLSCYILQTITNICLSAHSTSTRRPLWQKETTFPNYGRTAFPSFPENSFMAFLVYIQVLIRETIDRSVPKGDWLSPATYSQGRDPVVTWVWDNTFPECSLLNVLFSTSCLDGFATSFCWNGRNAVIITGFFALICVWLACWGSF